jgi:hypothetical protein
MKKMKNKYVENEGQGQVFQSISKWTSIPTVFFFILVPCISNLSLDKIEATGF